MRPAALWLLLVLACAQTGGVTEVTGSVVYRERIALPLGAVVRVTLADVSHVDMPERVITSVEIRPEARQVPIYFSLELPSRQIDDERSYALRAQILDADGRLLFASSERQPVLTRGAPNEAEILVQRVGGGRR
jgi:putative lipoprotein